MLFAEGLHREPAIVTRVLIAVDETEASVRAAEVAHRLFGDAAEYIAVSVAGVEVDEVAPWWDSAWGVGYPVPYGATWALPGLVGPAAEERVDDERPTPGEAAALRAEQTARSTVEQTGLVAEPVGEIGEPVAAVLDAAEQRSADVIVVGSHERGWFQRMLHGSVGDELVGRSTIPVLIAH